MNRPRPYTESVRAAMRRWIEACSEGPRPRTSATGAPAREEKRAPVRDSGTGDPACLRPRVRVEVTGHGEN